MQKLGEKLTTQELKNASLSENIKDQAVKIEILEKESKKLKDLGVNNLISMSLNIYDTILNVILDDSIDSSKISTIQKSLNSFSNLNIDGNQEKIKDHFAVLLKSLLDISKRLLHARNELKTQDEA